MDKEYIEKILTVVTGLHTESCPITNCEILDPVSTPCGHVFEKEAIINWLTQHDICPICKKEFSTDIKIDNVMSNNSTDIDHVPVKLQEKQKFADLSSSDDDLDGIEEKLCALKKKIIYYFNEK